MKKIYLLLLLTIIGKFIVAQTITSFVVSPAYPTADDTVTIYIQCDFSYMGCEGTGFYNGTNGSEVSAGGIHCMGMLTALCTDYDTIVVPPMAAGHYTFVYVLSTGQQPGCIPGTIPIDIDSVHFTVTSTSGIESISANNSVKFYPNPSTGKITLQQKEFAENKIQIYSSEGKLVKDFLFTNLNEEVDLKLAPGIYCFISENGKARTIAKLVMQ
jgi:hypothetical protein